ncbi:MAG: nitroreductase family protein [Lachnospiraceae bacterium]|nr:nitroreductase family protein [Lachnospiraceae bacterium]
MIQAIAERRSIRRYTDKDVPRRMIEEIIQAGILAPSAKNRQPWKFVVVTGNAKTKMLAAMQKGLAREKKEPLLPESALHLSGAEHTLSIMRQAPVTIFIMNVLAEKIGNCVLGDAPKKEMGGMLWQDTPEKACGEQFSTEDRITEICNTQSIGAAIENMALAATDLGLGSLWICDTFFAQNELDEWLGAEGELFAALTIGYADETPHARPRKSMEDVVEWRDGAAVE